MKNKPIPNKRGSVLVLVTLLTLILASFAIVALRSVSRTVQSSAIYTTRHLATESSNSANRVTGRFVGDRYAGVWREMQAPLYGESSDGDSMVLGGSSDVSSRMDRLMRGPYAKFDNDDLEEFLGGNSNLFGDSATPSFENRLNVEYSSIIRDPYDFPPPPGESATGNTCSKKISIFTEATVGDLDVDWNAANNFGRTRLGLEGVISNVDCGT